MKFALKLSAIWSRLANWWIKKLDDKRWAERLQAAYTVLPNDTAKQLLQNQVASLRRDLNSYGRQEFIQRDRTDKLNHMLFLIAVAEIQGLLELSKIVGVQPLTGPVGLAFRMTYGEVEQPQDDERPEGGKRMRLSIVKHPVEARTQRMQARLNIEHTQDAYAIHPGLSTELTSALGHELTFECFNAVIDDLRRLAMKNDVIAVEPAECSLADALVLHVNKAVNQIGRATWRGVGNFIIGSAETLETLKASQFFAPKEHKADRMLKLVGELNNGTIKVYEFASVPVGELLVGYNGTNATDTGYIYGPYVPLLMSGPIIDPQTYETIFGAMTRHGKNVITEATKEAPVVSADYYRIVKL